MGSSSSSQAKNFSQLMAGTDDQAISQAVTDSYDLLHGAWPEEYNQVVLVLDENNSLSTASLYQLGLISAQQYLEIQEQIADGAEVTPLSWDYETICGHTFSLVPASDRYSEKEDGTFAYTADSTPQQEQLVKNGITLTISGVIHPKTDAANATISTPVAYTSQLTDYVIEHTNVSAVVTAQEETPEINVLNGMEFEAPSQEEKIEDAKTYLSSMGVSDKAAMFQMIQYYLAQEQTGVKFSGDPSQLSQGNGSMVSSMGSADEAALTQALDLWLADSPDPDILLSIYDETIAGASYEENMENFGKVSYDAPSSISIYTDSFEDKESVSQCIADYNKEAREENQITYTDYVELMTQPLTSIVDIISYVLIAFVAVSLVVSCIMIGIITHISVMERTKEIGILRAMGASKRNISQVFNAETFIIGCLAGALGVLVSALLTIPINAILQSLLDASSLTVALPVTCGGFLVLLSILITMLGGLLPAKNAAKKIPWPLCVPNNIFRPTRKALLQLLPQEDFLHKNNLSTFGAMDHFEPFSAPQPEDAPDAFDDLIDFQHGIDPERRPMEYHPRQIPQGDRSHPQEEDVAHHQKFGISPGPQHAFGENGVHGLENNDKADGVHQAPGDLLGLGRHLIIVDDGAPQQQNRQSRQASYQKSQSQEGIALPLRLVIFSPAHGMTGNDAAGIGNALGQH